MLGISRRQMLMLLLKCSEFSRRHNLTAGQLFFSVHIILLLQLCHEPTFREMTTKELVWKTMSLSALRGVWNCGSFLYNLNSELKVYPQFPSATSANIFFASITATKEKRRQKPCTCPVQNVSVLPSPQFYCMLSLKSCPLLQINTLLWGDQILNSWTEMHKVDEFTSKQTWLTQKFIW